MGEVIQHSRIIDDHELREMLDYQHGKILKKYQGDFNGFVRYCEDQQRELDFRSVIAYMKRTIVQEERKRSTWDRRLAAIKKHLDVVHGIVPTKDELNDLRALRNFYNEDGYEKQRRMVGQSAEVKDELISAIENLTVKVNGYKRQDTRMIAISLVNLVTANRPSEMTRLKVSDFNLKERIVHVNIKKQGKDMYKVLTRECVAAVKKYIQEYDLLPDDYFVTKVTRHQTVVRNKATTDTEQMTEVGYNKLIQTKLQMNPYCFRKTQVTAMHEAGADLSVIARQSGHESLETIAKHYLTVRDKEVEKYI